MKRKQISWLISGIGLSAGLGAGLMYLFDPDRGRRRRTMVRDKVNHNVNEMNMAVQRKSRDLNHRAQGLFARMKTSLNGAETTADVLEARVRARMGHIINHASSIEVEAKDGCITVSGPIMASKVERLMKAITGVPGVKSVTNKLEVYEPAGVIAGMKGEAARPLIH